MLENIDQQFFELQARLAAVQVNAQEAPERLRPTFEIAVANANDSLSAFFASEVTIAAVEAKEKALDSDFHTIQSLLEEKLLTDDQAAEEVRRLAEHKDYALLRAARTRDFGRIILPGAVEALEPIAREEDQPNPSKSIVKVYVGPHSINVDNTIYKDTIYGSSKERKRQYLRAIQTLDDSQMVSPRELWDIAYPGTPYDKVASIPALNWVLENVVSDADAPLMIHNGKRGNGSRYVRNPDVVLELIDTTPDDEKAPFSPDGSESVKVPEVECMIIKSMLNQLLIGVGEPASEPETLELSEIPVSFRTPEQATKLVERSIHMLKEMIANEAAAVTKHEDNEAPSPLMISILPIINAVGDVLDDNLLNELGQNTIKTLLAA